MNEPANISDKHTLRKYLLINWCEKAPEPTRFTSTKRLETSNANTNLTLTFSLRFKLKFVSGHRGSGPPHIENNNGKKRAGCAWRDVKHTVVNSDAGIVNFDPVPVPLNPL